MTTLIFLAHTKLQGINNKYAIKLVSTFYLLKEACIQQQSEYNLSRPKMMMMANAIRYTNTINYNFINIG